MKNTEGCELEKLVEGGHVDWILASARDTQQQARAMLGEVLVGGRAHGLHHMCIDVGLRELLGKLLVALLLAELEMLQLEGVHAQLCV